MCIAGFHLNWCCMKQRKFEVGDLISAIKKYQTSEENNLMMFLGYKWGSLYAFDFETNQESCWERESSLNIICKKND